MKKFVSFGALIALLCMFLGLATVGYFAFAETDFSTSAQSAVVMEQSTHRILFEKQADLRLPMASTTKIATALTVLNNANLDEVVKVSPKAVGIEGSSIYLRAGEHLTVRELLLGLMLQSGNDCAVALALHVAGSVERFADMMNDTARQLGCNDTHFVNPHGLHDDDHYTSARDLAVLTCCALQNKDFCDIVSAKSARIANEGMEYERLIVNKNKLLKSFDGADGVKTGYTKKAGRCFVGSATRNGMQVVVVVLNCGPMFEETAQMLNTAFDNYSMETIVPQNYICGTRRENGKTVYYACRERCRYPLKRGERAHVDVNMDDLALTVSLNGEQIFEHALQAIYSR